MRFPLLLNILDLLRLAHPEALANYLLPLPSTFLVVGVQLLRILVACRMSHVAHDRQGTQEDTS